MKNKNLIILVILLVLIILGTLVLLKPKPKEIIYTTETIPSCLFDKAEEYCDDEEYVGVNYVYDDYFYCVIKDYPRTKTTETTSKIYFLDREIRGCSIIKLVEK